MDVVETKVDISLTVVRALHAKIMAKSLEFFKRPNTTGK